MRCLGNDRSGAAESEPAAEEVDQQQRALVERKRNKVGRDVEADCAGGRYKEKSFGGAERMW